MKISAVVKCHLLDNELLEMTRDALETIKPYVDELIIVDHGSDIGGGYLRGEANIYLRYDKSRGFPYTAAHGIALAKHKHVAVLNNDILFFGDWVKDLEGLEDYALIHPKMLDWNMPVEKGNTVRENIRPEEGMFFSAFIINKDKYIGWDTDYNYWGYDDWDYYYRLLESGEKAVWTDKTVYWHKGGATIRKIGRDQFVKENIKIFEDKHGINPHDINWSVYAGNE